MIRLKNRQLSLAEAEWYKIFSGEDKGLFALPYYCAIDEMVKPYKGNVLDLGCGAIKGLSAIRKELINFYDAILMIEVLAYVEDPRSYMVDALKHCKALIITVPLGEDEDNKGFHIIGGWTRCSFKGFNILDYKTFMEGRRLAISLEGRYRGI